jgi:hypothetical protein
MNINYIELQRFCFHFIHSGPPHGLDAFCTNFHHSGPPHGLDAFCTNFHPTPAGGLFQFKERGMSELDRNKTIEQLLTELTEARKRLDETTEAERTARSQRIDAVNVFNGVTKRLDAAYRKLRESAPHDTDWSRPAPQRVAIP